MPAAAQIIDLRRVLAERFPKAHAGRSATARDGVPAGMASLDSLLGGGWPRGQVSELVTGDRGSGATQVLHRMLERVAADGGFLAWVDGSDSFDVDAADPASLERLLWVRCTDSGQAIQAADLLLRDRNIPLVVLDLGWNPAAQLRRIPSTVWHRFGRLVEHNGATRLVVAPHPLVGSPACRVRLRSRLTVDALHHGPAAVSLRIRCELERAPAAQVQADRETRPLARTA
jgi:hypothetical protein